jgi:predicted nucleic acid-binding protein
VKTSTLIDTNILIDVWGRVSETSQWSRDVLMQCRREGTLIINQIIWSELAPSVAFSQLAAYANELEIRSESLPFDAAHSAGRVHARYRRAGGVRERTLPDFLIGAHAVGAGYRLLTRDARRYRQYFPDLEVIAPDTHP